MEEFRGDMLSFVIFYESFFNLCNTSKLSLCNLVVLSLMENSSYVS